MKLICLQENLKNGLNIVQNIIGKNLTLPILNNLLLETKLGRLKISSTNLEIGINCWISGKIEKEGEITIPAKIITNFINNLPNKKIELETKDNLLFIKCENYKAKLKGLSAKEFPIIPQIKDKSFCQIPSNNLKKSLLQVINMVALSESRPEISGVLFKFNKNNLKLVATDSFRLAEKNIFNLKNQISQSIIIPQRTIQELIRILTDKEDKEVKIKLDKNQILFDLDDVQVVSRLIDGQYPDYEQIIPKDFNLQVIIDKKEFLNTVRVASIFSGKINSIKIIFEPQKSIVKIFSEDLSLGENESQLSAEFDLKKPINKEENKIEINFNYKYILDGLSALEDSVEKVVLGINDELSPVVIKGVGDNSYLYLVMPIRG